MIRLRIAAVGAALIVGGGSAQASVIQSQYMSARRAVCYYFGSYCWQAMRVVRCETGGTYSPWAVNGQYVNIFQMGYHERRTYGWHVRGSSVWLAARAAWHYFKASHYTWRAWSCKP